VHTYALGNRTRFCRDKLGLDGALGSIDSDKLNVVGSSLAFRASLSRRRVDASSQRLAKLLEERGSGRGLVSVCTAGGMGVTAIVER
jgi:acetyl-CoA C-acetyltransferase